MKIGMIILRILQGIYLAFLIVAGIGSMPSVFGMTLLMMAVFATPGKMRTWLLEDKVMRAIWSILLIFYFSYLPTEDVSMAGKNMGRFLLRLWETIQCLFGV